MQFPFPFFLDNRGWKLWKQLHWLYVEIILRHQLCCAPHFPPCPVSSWLFLLLHPQIKHTKSKVGTNCVLCEWVSLSYRDLKLLLRRAVLSPVQVKLLKCWCVHLFFLMFCLPLRCFFFIQTEKKQDSPFCWSRNKLQSGFWLFFSFNKWMKAQEGCDQKGRTHGSNHQKSLLFLKKVQRLHQQNVQPSTNRPIACAEYFNLHVKQIILYASTCWYFCMPKCVICALHYLFACVQIL